MLTWSRGRGADAVLVCAASDSSAPVARAPALCRDRAAVVIVGDVGLSLDRTPFYERELSLRFARSYGPGRYDTSYEAWGVDYPAGQVRWTEGRNFEAVLDLLAAGRLKVADLVTHCYDIADAAAAYELIEKRADPYLAIQLTYPKKADADVPVLPKRTVSPADPAPGSPSSPSSPPAMTGSIVPAPRPPLSSVPSVSPPPGPLPPESSPSREPPASSTASAGSQAGIGWIGAGAFSTGTLLPAFRRAGFKRFVAVTSASGITARRAAERYRFDKAVSGTFPVIDDPDVGDRGDRHPARHPRRAGGARPEGRAARVVREAAGPEHGRACAGRGGLGGVRSGSS